MAARPKQPVARGGMWSTTKPQNISKETSDLLKVMMEESKLTNFQRRKLQEDIKKGQALPMNCPPTSSRSGARNKSHVVRAKQTTGRKQHSHSGKRRKEVIDALKEQNKISYQPAPGKVITDKDKEMLQNMMAYGKDAPPIRDTPKKIVAEVEPEEEIDRFEEVLLEIEDRRKFLAEMESLGQGAKYRTLINTEISQKIRELELIDRERSAQLDGTVEESTSRS